MTRQYTKKVLRRAPLLIGTVAFVIRAVLLYATKPYAITMSYEPNNVAQAVAAGLGLANPYGCVTGPSGHLAPLFPWFSGALLAITGAYWGLAKSLVSITVVSLLWAAMPRASRMLGFTRAAGVLAGFAGALLPVAMSTELRGDWEAPYIAAALLIVAMQAVRVERMPVLRATAGVRHGFWWGVFLLGMPNALLLIPGWMYRVCRERWRACTGYILAAAAAVVLVVTPYVIYSRIRVGHWFFIRDNFGLELFVSNRPESALVMMENMAGVMNKYHPLLSPEACAEVQRLGEQRYEKERLHEALQFIQADPLTFISRAAQHGLWQIFPWTTDWKRNILEWAIALAALAGCVIAIRQRRPYIWFLIGGAGLYLLPYLFVQGSPRYRYPVWWLLVLLGAFAVRVVLRRWGSGPSR